MIEKVNVSGFDWKITEYGSSDTNIPGFKKKKLMRKKNKPKEI